MGTATLLCEFIQTQPPHLYQVLDTPLFSNLLRCLQLDSSTTAVSLTLTALTMLMPHSPSAMVPHLPTLFNIYARLLFWHVQHSEDTDVPYEQIYLGDPTGWEACSYSRDLDGPDIPSLRNYFTILYGLYPINFMDYIRKPHRYLRHANDPSAGVVEIQPSEIRHKSEEFRRGHLLHPNFYHLTIESEKTDHGRWQASEPAEVVAECAALCIMEDQPRPEPIEEPPQTRRKSSMLSGDESNSSLRDFPLLRVVSTDGGRRAGDLANKDSADSYSQSPNENESPTVTSQLAVSPSETQLQELLHSNKLIKSGLQQSLSNDSVPSLSLNHQESITGLQNAPRARAESSVSTADAQSKLSQLRGQILLLQNDLSFERYLKQQHIAHMGELRRRQVKEAASEAEMQNLIIANRNLKSRFEEAKKAEMQVKRESEKSRSLAKKWEADLSTKLKTLREEAKKTKAERDDLKRELEISQTECDELKSRLCGFEVRELNWEQNAQSHEIDKSEMDRLKSELARLTATERYFQGKEDQMKQALETAASVEAQIPALDAKLAAQEEDHQRAREAYEEQIAALKSKIVARKQDDNSERLSASANCAIESALAASRARQAELKKQYDLLSRKYTALQSSLFDMQCDSSPESGPGKPDASVPSGSDGLHGQAVPVSSSPAQARAGIQRVATSPEVIEHTSAKSATTSSIARPGALVEPSESSTSIPTIASGSEPRFLGRGTFSISRSFCHDFLLAHEESINDLTRPRRCRQSSSKGRKRGKRRKGWEGWEGKERGRQEGQEDCSVEGDQEFPYCLSVLRSGLSAPGDIRRWLHRYLLVGCRDSEICP